MGETIFEPKKSLDVRTPGEDVRTLLRPFERQVKSRRSNAKDGRPNAKTCRTSVKSLDFRTPRLRSNAKGGRSNARPIFRQFCLFFPRTFYLRPKYVRP